MALDVNLPYGFENFSTSITVDNATRAKVLVDKQAATGSFLGGFRVIDGNIATTDSNAKSALIWFGEELTLAANMGTASIATTSTMTRTSGDFLADGWKIGDTAMLVHALAGPNGGTAANYGTAYQVTGAATATLTFNGTGLTAETIQAGARLVRVVQRTRRAVAANAGNADATPAVALMGGTQDPAAAALPDTGWQFGPRGMLLVSLVAATAALPARHDFTAAIARY